MKPRLPIDLKPGDVVDRKGTPVLVGDLVRTDHFRGARGKRYYLYHLVTQRDGVLYMTPVHQLATGKKDGGECYLHSVADRTGVLPDADVIDGQCPAPDDRRRRKPPSPLPTPASNNPGQQ